MGTPPTPVEVAKSPSGNKPQPAVSTLTFPEAMQEIRDGARVTKMEWGDPQIEVYLDGALKITLATNDYKPTDLILRDGDIMGDDWVVTGATSGLDKEE